MTSTSSIGSWLPMASAPICQCSRKRPAWGRSYRNIGATYQSFTGRGSLCMPCCTNARTTGAVPSGRRVRLVPPSSSKVYISLRTMSVLVPTPRTKSAVSSKVGVTMRRYP